MTDNIAKIRAFVDLMRNHAISVAYGRQLYAADSALSELERAAAEPAAYQYSHPSGGGKIWRNEQHWNGYTSNEARALYAAPPAPVAPIASLNDRQRLEAIIEVLDRYLPPDAPLTEHEAMNEIIGLVDPLPPAPVAEIREPTREMVKRVAADFYGSEYTGADSVREVLKLWQRELGPTLGMIELKEPTPEECERICTAYFVGKMPASHVIPLGRAISEAVVKVMWPKSEAK